MVERDVFTLKPKLWYHLSRWGECVYGAYSLQEKRLLCESAFAQIDERTLILKLVEREVFLMKPKHQLIYPNVENEFLGHNH